MCSVRAAETQLTRKAGVAVASVCSVHFLVRLATCARDQELICCARKTHFSMLLLPVRPTRTCQEPGQTFCQNAQLAVITASVLTEVVHAGAFWNSLYDRPRQFSRPFQLTPNYNDDNNNISELCGPYCTYGDAMG